MKDLFKALLEFAAKGTAAWRISLTLGLALFIAWASGLLPHRLGGGFAYADDAEKVHDELRVQIGGIKTGLVALETKIDKAEQDRLEAEIFTKRIEQCQAPEGDLKVLYAGRVAELVGKWRAITGQPTADPPTLVQCRELGGAPPR